MPLTDLDKLFTVEARLCDMARAFCSIPARQNVVHKLAYGLAKRAYKLEAGS